MFLFEPLPWYSVLMWFVVLGGLILVNELARINKWFSLAIFLVLPAILPFAVWQYTAAPGSSVGTWFHWAKVYSALAGSLGFLAIRNIKGWGTNKYALLFPPAILAINILEAVVRDFQSYSVNGLVDGVLTIGGPWNIMNGIAGLINIITITGWMGIFIGRDQKKDMLWPDMLWFWIIAYDIWNLVYIWFCVPEHAGYGIPVLLACTIPSLLIKRGTWIQARAFTLAAWMMYVFTFPQFIDTPGNFILLPNQPALLLVVGLISLGANGVYAYLHFTKMFRQKTFGFGQPVHAG